MKSKPKFRIEGTEEGDIHIVGILFPAVEGLEDRMTFRQWRSVEAACDRFFMERGIALNAWQRSGKDRPPVHGDS